MVMMAILACLSVVMVLPLTKTLTPHRPPIPSRCRYIHTYLQTALDLFNKGRLMNISFFVCNIIVTSVWSSIPESALFCKSYIHTYIQTYVQHLTSPPTDRSLYPTHTYIYRVLQHLPAATRPPILCLDSLPAPRRLLHLPRPCLRLGPGASLSHLVCAGYSLLTVCQTYAQEVGGGGERTAHQCR